MNNDNEFLINSGEIYTHEYTNWQDNADLRKYMEEMETLILNILWRNKLPAVTSDKHDQEYFKTKRDQFESAQLKALDDKNSPFTHFSVHKSDGGETAILSSEDYTMDEVAELILNGGESKDIQWALYNYSDPYTIIKDSVDPDVFEFFFAFKLRQVDLMETDEFLDYHLDTSYEKNRAEFIRFLDLILRKHKLLFDADKVNTINEWISMSQSKKTDEHTMINDSDKIEWLGSQKELAELFVELKRKNWIKDIDARVIQQAFTKSTTIQQVLKPATDKHTLEDTYEQIYTKGYYPNFHRISFHK